MKHLRPLNLSAQRRLAGPGLRPYSVPAGCATVFAPGWETDSRGGTIGLCQPWHADFPLCANAAGTCWWPAQVQDVEHYGGDVLAACPSFQNDWQRICFVPDFEE